MGPVCGERYERLWGQKEVMSDRALDDRLLHQIEYRPVYNIKGKGGEWTLSDV